MKLRLRSDIYENLMMALGTLCIGLIPSYATIGFWSPTLLILFRLVQGFSTGGEYGGASTFIAEYAPDKNLFRTVMIDFIPIGSTYKDVLSQVCGGSLEQIQLFEPVGNVTNFMTARVVFNYELGASTTADRTNPS